MATQTLQGLSVLWTDKPAANIGLNEMAREVFYASVTFLF